MVDPLPSTLSSLSSSSVSSIGYHLRRARPEDRAALYDVCLKTGDGHGGDGTHLYMDRPNYLGDMYVGPYLDRYPDLAFSLIDERGHPVGYLLGCPERVSQDPWEDDYPSHMHIDLLPCAQGRGFGRIMVQRLMDVLRGLGVPGVHLKMMASNERAFGFYQKLGFEKIAESGGDWVLARKL